jgi:hypothetical protein
MMGLPSLQELDQAPGGWIWLVTKATDMRCEFDRLVERVKAVMGQEPLSGHLLVFPFATSKSDRPRADPTYPRADSARPTISI